MARKYCNECVPSCISEDIPADNLEGDWFGLAIVLQAYEALAFNKLVKKF